MAVDGDSTNPHRIRKTSSKEYYDLCGFNLATDGRRRWMVEDQDARPLTDGMPSVKTTILDNLRVAITYRLHNFWDICRHYDQDWRYRVLQLKSYKGRQKGLEEIGRRLTFGSATYGSDPRPHRYTVTRASSKKAPKFCTPISRRQA